MSDPNLPALADRRKHQRLVMNLRVMLALGESPPEPATLIDISEGGCLLRSGVLTGDVRVSFSLVVSPGSLPCDAAGSIVRTAGQGLFGIQFDQINGELVAFIRMALSMDANERQEIINAIKQPVVRILRADPR